MGKNNKQVKDTDLDTVVERDFGFVNTLAEIIIWDAFVVRDIEYLLLFKKKLNQLISKKQREQKKGDLIV